MIFLVADHFWYSNWNYGYPWHPHWRAPRCLPCHSDTDISQLRMNMTKTCPCTPEALCGLEGGYDNVLDKRKCTPPRSLFRRPIKHHSKDQCLLRIAAKARLKSLCSAPSGQNAAWLSPVNNVASLTASVSM